MADDDLPAVLSLLHESDKRWRTLCAEGDEWVDDERNTAAFMRNLRPGAFVTSRGGRREWSGTSAFPGESLRVGVVFADGRTSVAENFTGPPVPVSDVRLVPLHGSGTQDRFDQRFWVEPLPPAGPLGVVVEWVRRRVPETRVDLDGRAILEAAARAQTLWP